MCNLLLGLISSAWKSIDGLRLAQSCYMLYFYCNVFSSQIGNTGWLAGKVDTVSEDTGVTQSNEVSIGVGSAVGVIVLLVLVLVVAMLVRKRNAK